MARILVKTTIPTTEDDWHIGRFAMLTDHLAATGHHVTARDRIEDAAGNDADLAALDRYDQLWLFAVDETGALTNADCQAIAAFQKAGGGVMLSRDHMNLGACVTKIGDIGLTQHFQKTNPEADEARQAIDDRVTTNISWPNYHSGANGDLQQVVATEPVHPVMADDGGRPLALLPAHPHEGAVGVPAGLAGVARVVAQGQSKVSGNAFNIGVAVDRPGEGKVYADSSFHHFCDYNLDPAAGCPSFVTEPAGDAIVTNADGLRQAKRYAANIAGWLGG